jgi:hypothetical protein
MKNGESGLKPFLPTILASVLASAVLSSAAVGAESPPLPDPARIEAIIRLNGELKAAGYYMAESEFQFLGVAYRLDRGKTGRAMSDLEALQRRFTTRDGLVKVPAFANAADELAFYRGLQNPRTGAFMDDSAPPFTNIAPTLNMIEHLEPLAAALGQPLRLDYPLRFLDRIDRPDELKGFLDDTAWAGPVGARLPKTPFVAATEIIDYPVFERNGLHRFSPVWKRTLKAWFYDHQDPATGFWGPRSREGGELLGGGELGSTFHVVRLFVDGAGRDRDAAFPLRHVRPMIETVLAKLAEPMPESVALQHDWSLTRGQGIRMLTRFLWPRMSEAERERARHVMTDLITNRFERFFVAGRGAFGLYADATEPDLDGTGSAISLLDQLGAFSDDERRRLWGADRPRDLGSAQADLSPLTRLPEVNAIRLYDADPGTRFDWHVAAVVYPRPTRVLDPFDLIQRVRRWMSETPQSMGNWVSKGDLAQSLAATGVPATVEVLTVDSGASMPPERGTVTAVGFDRMQTPVARLRLVPAKRG